jgi:hypothetical protein
MVSFEHLPTNTRQGGGSKKQQDFMTFCLKKSLFFNISFDDHT